MTDLEFYAKIATMFNPADGYCELPLSSDEVDLDVSYMVIDTDTGFTYSLEYREGVHMVDVNRMVTKDDDFMGWALGTHKLPEAPSRNVPPYKLGGEL